MQLGAPIYGHSAIDVHPVNPGIVILPKPVCTGAALQSIRVARPWEDGSQLCVPLEPLHASHAMEQPRMDAPMNDGLVMTNELQRLLADMDWG